MNEQDEKEALGELGKAIEKITSQDVKRPIHLAPEKPKWALILDYSVILIVSIAITLALLPFLSRLL